MKLAIRLIRVRARHPAAREIFSQGYRCCLVAWTRIGAKIKRRRADGTNILHYQTTMKLQKITIVVAVATFVALSSLPKLSAGESSGLLDTLSFGDAVSEQGHGMTADRAETITGGLNESARRFLPLAPEDWQGGSATFTLKVDPEKLNYVTARFWGSDTSASRMILFCEGKQIGYRHLGDIDVLDFGDDSGEPGCNGRFLYNTTPLPLAMTQGKTNLHFEIRSTGPVWGYASSFAQYQKPMTVPTRGIYEIYTHTDGSFVPPAAEKQGSAPQNPPVRQTPGAEVFDKLKSRVNGEIKNLLASAKPLNEMQMQFLARAYFVKWTDASQNPLVVTQVIKGLDALSAAYRDNPGLASHDPSTPNPGWFEFGPAGDTISLLATPLQRFLDTSLDDGGKKISRRAAYSELLQAGRDWHRQHRRLYSNQTMITDMNLYLSNRGLEAIDPINAFTEAQARRYLYEALALEPWRDSDPGGGEAAEHSGRTWGVGTNYWQLTAKGLTRELGYVGYYGEVLDWATSIYDATRPAPGQPGDEKIKTQLEKIIHARANFRYPMLDGDGNRAMRIETIVGWRDMHYPGDIVYGERPTWDASTLYAAAATLDPQSIGYAQQMFADNQFFASVQHQMEQNNSLRVTAGLLSVPEQYELLMAQPATTYRLPMTSGQPDFVFSDEEDGVVAVKNGSDILYVSLYWRSRFAVNFLARVHLITPGFDRIAVVHEDIQFEPSGMTYTRPDWINFGFGGGGPRYPMEMHSAEAGEKLPIAKIPDGVIFHSGDENVYAGKGEFYTLRYGDYLIGMNMTTGKTFELKIPTGFAKAKELVSQKMVEPGANLKVAPRSTVVLYLDK